FPRLDHLHRVAEKQEEGDRQPDSDGRHPAPVQGRTATRAPRGPLRLSDPRRPHCLGCAEAWPLSACCPVGGRIEHLSRPLLRSQGFTNLNLARHDPQTGITYQRMALDISNLVMPPPPNPPPEKQLP